METIFVKRQMERTIKNPLQLIVHHEAIKHNGRIFRIQIQVTEHHPFLSSFAKVDILTECGWVLFLNTDNLGINFNSVADILNNQYEPEKERIAAMDGVVSTFKEYIQLF